MANIKEVAKRAGVGIATVSRVINNSGYVGKKTREKVEAVIKELNYKPNEIARSMLKQKNNIVAFILPTSSHPFFGALLNHLEDELYKNGYKMLLCNSNRQIEKEIAYLDMLNNNRVDAIVFLTNNDIEQYLDKSLPIISFDRHFENVPLVSSENYKGGRLAAEVLISKGCKNLMFVGDDAQVEGTVINTEVIKRREGFNDYCNEHGFQVKNVVYPLRDYSQLPEYIEKVILEAGPIDGIFTISDAIGIEVIKVLERNNIRVPEDVSVIGFDGTAPFLNLGKVISSIEQSPEELAKAISETINDYVNEKEVRNRFVPIKFKQGETA